MIVLHVSKYFERSSRTSSASRDSESVVNPTRSANSTDTSRRSAEGAGDREAAAGAGAPPRAEPHAPQNLFVGGFGVPHDAHTLASGLPHAPQNLLVSAFSAPHVGQVT